MNNFKLEYSLCNSNGNCRYDILYNGTNKNGEKMYIELSKCFDNGSKYSLPKLWYKEKYTNRLLKTYWFIRTYVYDEKDDCYARYNPQTKIYTRYQKDKVVENRLIIDFDWMLEGTKENATLLLNECEKLFLQCKKPKAKIVRE